MTRSLYVYYGGEDDSSEIMSVFLFVVMFEVVIRITCPLMTCPGKRLCAIGVLRILLSVYLLAISYGALAGPEFWLGVIWILEGKRKITMRGQHQEPERAALIPQQEDVDDPVVRVNCCYVNSQPEIVPAEIVDVGSLSYASVLAVGDPQNPPKRNTFGEAERSVPTARAIPETRIGMGLEHDCNHSEELATSNDPQTNNEQQDTLERGDISLFDRYSYSF
jgi:hypothetical protein